MFLNYRTINLLGVLICFGGLAFALYLQHYQNLEPCPMCIFQRVAMLGAGIAFYHGMLVAPRGTGRWFFALWAALASAIGAFIAGRHVWLQSLPEDQRPACGPTLDYLVDILPLREVVQTVLRGDGNCAKIDWTFLSLSLPFWTMLGFIALIIFSLLTPLVGRSKSQL